jgi:hypothetical protein
MNRRLPPPLRGAEASRHRRGPSAEATAPAAQRRESHTSWPGCVQLPRTPPDHVEGHRAEQMLQRGLGQPAVPGLAQAAAPDGVRLCPLGPGPPGILGCELGRFLPLPRGLDRLVMGLPDRELAGGIFGPGARLAGWTDATGRSIKADAHNGAARDIVPRRPFHTSMPLGTAGLLGFPIQHKGG